MNHSLTLSARRHDRAEKALNKLGRHRSERQELSVECRQGHRVAAVYSTEMGSVFLSRIGPHAHGDLDLPDVGHRSERLGRDFVDMLHATWADDDLPAWCDCGSRGLSRAALEAAIAAGRRRILVD